jgi:signal transduction histidine kinase
VKSLPDVGAGVDSDSTHGLMFVARETPTVGDMEIGRRLGKRLGSVDPLVADGALVVLLATITLVEIALSREGVSTSDAAWSAFFMLTQTLPLALRRRNPFTVTLVVAISSIVYDVLSIPPDPNTAILAQLVALYSVAAYARPRLAYAAAAITLGALALLNLPGIADRETFASLTNEIGLFVGAWVLGQNTRFRRRETELLRDRAEQAEREQRERERVAALEERSRLAREIHDVIAHGVSVIAVQAGAARSVAEQRPDRAREALSVIEEVSKQTMTEVRRAVGALRGPDERGALAAAPGLEELGPLAERVRRTGVDVEISTSGTPHDLPTTVGSSAYRIVQEALTNTVKHAGPTSAHVRVRYEPGWVELVVSDDGPSGSRDTPPASSRDGGQGLIGIRERVEILGGTFETRHTDPGFEVHARLPIDGQMGFQ